MRCLITEDLVREEFPALSDTTWFCTGTVGIMPRSAAERMAEARLKYETELVFQYHEIGKSVNALRERLASLISAEEANNVCFTRNATEGIAIGLSNIELEPGDEILTSNQEHGALLVPVNYIHHRGRAKLRMFEISKDPEETLQSVKSQISDKTKIVAFSHVSCQTGIRLPVKEICKVAREVDAYVLIDGAQTIGNISVNVQEYDCDFYVGNGHKWLCGPRGTSFLYINPNSELEISPFFLAFWNAGDSITIRNATIFEYGTRDRMLLYGFWAVMDLYAKWNWQLHGGRIKELSTYLKDRLSDVPRCILHTPVDWANSSGNVSFSMEGHDWREVESYLSKDWRMRTRPVGEIDAVRVSTCYYNTYAEIDRLIEALEAL